MSLIPSAALTLGNLQYTTHPVDLVVTLVPLPGVSHFRATLPAGIELRAAPDDQGTLELDGGEGSETVLTGKVRAFHRRLMATDVLVGDAAAALARFRPCATYEKQNAKNVIRALAGDAGVSVDSIDIDLPLAAYVAHQGRTAAEHVATLAALAGGLARVNGDGELQVMSWPEGQPDLALRYGREIMEYSVTEHPGAPAQLMMIGSGTAGSPEAPAALRPSLDPLPDDAPDPGPDAVWTPAAVLRTPQTAKTASSAAGLRAGAQAQRVRARCFLLPALRPGVVIEVQDLPNDLSRGPWILTRVVHHLKPGRGGVTVFEGISGEGGGLASLLGAALAAVGSLL